MKKFFILLFSLILFNITFYFGQISLNIIPQKYDIIAKPGDNIRKKVSVRNNTSYTVNYYVKAKDFIPNNINGSPNWIQEGEYIPDIYKPYLLSKWVNLEITGFSLNPGEKKDIYFNINIPTDAIPGTYYGGIVVGILPDNGISGSNVQIGVIGEIATILLLTIPGEIKTQPEVKDIKIIPGGMYRPYEKPSNTPEKNNNLNKNNEQDEQDNNNFKFMIEFANKGNTYIKPKGKIIIYDENGKQLKNIGKETIIDKNGRVIGSKIVDYIPINDGGGAVLPNSKRFFEAELKGFYVKHYSPEKGDYEYKILPLETYCESLNKYERKYLYFWEIEKTRKKKIKLNGNIILAFTGIDGKGFNYNTGINLEITCDEKYIDINWKIVYIIIAIGLSILIIIILLIIALLRKNRKK